MLRSWSPSRSRKALVPEKRVGDLAPATGHQTFRVVMEWMKENREGWEKHLASQDRKLEEIHTEVRKTNGRVTDLENKAALAAALQLAEEKVEADLTAKQEKQLERGDAKRLALWAAAITGGAGIVGGVLGYAGHAVGAW